MKTVLLLFALVVGSGSVWADDVVGTINFGSANGSTPINGKNISGDDSQGNTWTITTVMTQTSFTQNASYSQVGSSSKPATSITFTTTLASAQTIKAFSAKFGGFNSTAGTVTLKVGDTTVGSGSLNGTNDVTVSATNTTTSGTVLTVTVTGIAKGVKCYYISYTYESSVVSSSATFANKTPSVNWPTNTTFTQIATTAEGYAGTAGASVTYSIGSTNNCGATINASTGEVSFTKSGTVIVNATAAEIAGHFSQSSDSYTLTVNDARETPTLSWSSYSVEIFKDAASYTLPTLNNPNSLAVTYSVTGTEGLASVTSAGVVTVNTGTVGTATVKATFEGNSTYKARTTSYTINVVDPTVKGSKYNPYTVSEIEALSENANGVYVTGYIVGCVTGSNSKAYKTTTGNWNNANLLIADTPDKSFDEGYNIGTTTADGLIPIELPSSPTTLRTNWGISNTSGAVIGYKVILKGNEQAYFTGRGIKGTSEITAVSVPVTPGHAKITYVTPQKMDFSEVSGLKAYVATDAASSGVTMTRVETVPENTPLLLIGTAGTTYNVPVAASATAPATNYLVKGDGTTVFNGKTYDYILYSDGKFYQIGSGTVATNKAYLHLDSEPSGARALDIIIDDDVTAIETVKSEKANNEYFNLAGQRVAQPTKGLYIVNGKKVIIK